MKKIIHKVKKIKKRTLYLIANSILLILIILIIILYIYNYLSIQKDYNVKAQEIYYTQNDKFTSPNQKENDLSPIATNTSSETTTITKNPEEIINNLKESLTTNDENNPDVRVTPGNYIEIINSCDSGYNGTCVRARSCPSLNCPVVLSLRNNIVLKTDQKEINADNITWTHIIFDEWRRYDDRLPKDMYVSSEFIKPIQSYKAKYKNDSKVQNLTNKKIIVDLGKQKLSAYNGDELFMEVSISSGLDDLPTPRGTFHIFEKTPSRYMQGPLPNISDQYYDLPGVPWTMYFTYQGAAIHGAYWHNNFGEQWSHGCVNLRPEDAELLYD